jgi:hypothetical protein
VTLIRGATGCGKSTQLPKLLLLQAAETKTAASIVVAQPRRLAAMALAERVSSELGEDGCGGLVGYRIRGEARVSSKTVITFTTTGLLLRQLEGDPNLESISHLIVDEVHERNVDTDLLLLVLRRALAARTTRCTIVLMSATVAAEPFVEYFASAVAGDSAQIGRYDIPGRAFAVEQLYLEDALAADARWMQWRRGVVEELRVTRERLVRPVGPAHMDAERGELEAEVGQRILPGPPGLGFRTLTVRAGDAALRLASPVLTGVSSAGPSSASSAATPEAVHWLATMLPRVIDPARPWVLDAATGEPYVPWDRWWTAARGNPRKLGPRRVSLPLFGEGS